jgi:hypothetical protein
MLVTWDHKPTLRQRNAYNYISSSEISLVIFFVLFFLFVCCFIVLSMSLIRGSVLQNVMNDDLKRIWKEAVVAQWRYAAGSNREFRAMLTSVTVEFRTRNLLATRLIPYRCFNRLSRNLPCKCSRIWMVVASKKIDTAVWVFVSSLYRIEREACLRCIALYAKRVFVVSHCTRSVSSLYRTVREGLTVWVGLIMFGKLGKGSKERISGSIPL